MAPEASGLASRVVGALRQAAITGLIAFGLLLPLIGFNTVQNIRNELILETRWPLLAAMVAIIAGGRFLKPLTALGQFRQLGGNFLSIASKLLQQFFGDMLGRGHGSPCRANARPTGP